MRFLVSGSNGLIGSALVARLVAEGHTVHRLVRSRPGPGDALLDADRRSIDASGLPGGTLDGLDAVFHLAGEPITAARWGAAKREAIRASRTATTDVLSRALRSTRNPPGVLVSGSAIGYYGDRGDELLVEGSRHGSGFLAEVCAAWEAATEPASEAGIRVVHARTGLVLGPGCALLAKLVPLFRTGLGGRLGSGAQWMSWIALEDEVGALVHAATTEELVGACNLVAPAPVRNTAFTAALAEVLGRPALCNVPAAAVRLALGRETAEDVALASQRVRPERLEATGYSFAVATVEEALVASLAPAPITRPGASRLP